MRPLHFCRISTFSSQVPPDQYSSLSALSHETSPGRANRFALPRLVVYPVYFLTTSSARTTVRCLYYGCGIPLTTTGDQCQTWFFGFAHEFVEIGVGSFDQLHPLHLVGVVDPIFPRDYDFITLGE